MRDLDRAVKADRLQDLLENFCDDRVLRINLADKAGLERYSQSLLGNPIISEMVSMSHPAPRKLSSVGRTPTKVATATNLLSKPAGRFTTQ